MIIIRLLVMAALLAVFVTPVSAAEFYVIKRSDIRKGQKPCGITSDKPQDMTTVIGGKGYATKKEADVARKAAAECNKK